MRTLRRVAVPVIAVAMLAAGCGSSAKSASSPNAAGAIDTPGTAYGEQPSESAKMICADEARAEIEAKLGEKIVKPVAPTWVDHLYSCDYVFGDGTMVLSVKEFPDIASTGTYFDHLASSRGTKSTLDFGEGGFQANDDSVVVRKDNKVLDINVSGLPARVGEFARVDVGPNVAAIVMGCWTGA